MRGTAKGRTHHLMNEHDREMFDWVRAFNPYDLYSKADDGPTCARCGRTTKS